MTKRRELLAGVGTVAVGSLAGCGALPWAGGDGDPAITVSPDAVPRLDRPASPFPVGVPDRLRERHVRRAREFLAEVPREPSIPNQAVASELAAQRRAVEEDLAGEPDDGWPLERLADRRWDRREAAEVAAAYRAATGDGDPEAVAGLRRRIRMELGPATADDRYRGSDPIEAVRASAPIEDIVATARRLSREEAGYPADPVAEPFRAGEAVARITGAMAALEDASRLREQYVASANGTEPQRRPLRRATDRLNQAVEETRDSVDEFLDVESSPFDRDLGGTAAGRLFEVASSRVSHLTEAFRSHHADGEFASAVVRCGQALAAIEALRAIIRGIRDEGYATETTVEIVRNTARRTREHLAAVTDSPQRGLAVMTAEPGFRQYEEAVRDVRDEYGQQGVSIHGGLAWCELYARAVPAATAFVADEIDAARSA